jgi:predicted Holliday junction resolvase-like endonuclease
MSNMLFHVLFLFGLIIFCLIICIINLQSKINKLELKLTKDYLKLQERVLLNINYQNAVNKEITNSLNSQVKINTILLKETIHA